MTGIDVVQIHCEIDYFYYRLSQLAVFSKDTRKPIEKMVDLACGFDARDDTTLKQCKEIIRTMEMIIRRKKKLDMDTSESEQRLKELKAKLRGFRKEAEI
jgi:hypothetical protein